MIGTKRSSGPPRTSPRPLFSGDKPLPFRLRSPHTDEGNRQVETRVGTARPKGTRHVALLYTVPYSPVDQYAGTQHDTALLSTFCEWLPWLVKVRPQVHTVKLPVLG